MTLTTKFMLIGLAMDLIVHSKPFRTEATQSTQVVNITASKFRFTPDRITLIKGQPVSLQLTSTDTTHGLMIRALKIDTDIKPGKVTEMTVTPAEAGTFRAICDHYCGLGHAGMKMIVVVEESAANSRAAKFSTASNASRTKAHGV